VRLQKCLPDKLQICLEIAFNDEAVERVKQPTLEEAYEILEAAVREQDAHVVGLLWVRHICMCKLLGREEDGEEARGARQNCE